MGSLLAYILVSEHDACHPYMALPVTLDPNGPPDDTLVTANI